MANPITKRQSDDARYAIRAGVIAQVSSVLIRSAAVVFCVRYGYLTITSFAGHETTLNAIVQATFKFDLTKYAAMFVAAACGVGWGRERSLRRKETKKLAADYKELEDVVHPGRSSSGLSQTGEVKKGRKS